MPRTKTTYRVRYHPFQASANYWSRVDSIPDTATQIPVELIVPLDPNFKCHASIQVIRSVKETWDAFLDNPLPSNLCDVLRTYISNCDALTSSQRLFINADSRGKLDIMPTYQLIGVTTAFKGFTWENRKQLIGRIVIT